MNKDLYLKQIQNISLKVFNPLLNKYIVSIYLYGSYAAGDFKDNKSDLDLFIVIKNSLPQRFEIEIKILESFWELVNVFFKGNKNITEKSHNPTILSVSEFMAHCNQYPARVLYPLKMAIWKCIYGEKIHEKIKFPNKKRFNKIIAHDFDSFANLWYKSTLLGDSSKAIKYFLRAVRKYIWIIHEKYIQNKEEILKFLLEIEPQTKCYKKIVISISDLLKNENVFLYPKSLDNLNGVLSYMGNKIARKLNLINKYSYDDFFNISPWRDYSWELRNFFNQYHYIKKDQSKDEFLFFLTQQHFRVIEYICWTISIPKEKIRFGISNLYLLNRSYIYKFNLTNFKTIKKVLKNESFYKIMIEHTNLIKKDFFSNLSIPELEAYIENVYLKNIANIFSSYLFY